MRKAICLIMSLGMLFLVTGCGAKKLTCTEERNGIITTTSFTFDKNNQATKMDMTIVQEYSDGYSKDDALQEMEEHKSDLEKMLDSYQKNDINVSIKAEDNGIKITLSGSIDAFKKAKELNEEEDISYDALKEKAIKDGETCK